MRKLAGQGAVLLALLFTISAAARPRPGDSGGDWPAIPPSELAATACPGNPDASAAILDYEVTTNDIMRFEDYSETIKICTPQGRHYGEVRIDYNPGAFNVSNIRAQTVKPSGAVIPFQGRVFKARAIKAGRFRRYEASFALPQVEVGDVIQYSYQLDWISDMPDAFNNPGNYFILAPTEFNTVRWKLVHTLFVQHEVFTWRPITKFAYFSRWLGLPPGTHLQKLQNGELQVVLNNVGPYLKEPRMPPVDPLTGHLYIFYFMVPSGSYEATPEAFTRDYWHGQGKIVAGNFDKFIGGEKNLRGEASQLTGGDSTPLAQLQALYERAQQVRDLDYEPDRTSGEEKTEKINPNRNVRDVLKHGYGTSYDVNALFAALARGAGFDVRSVVVTGVQSGPFDPNYTRWSQFDAQIVGVTVGKQQLYFDPSTKDCPFGLLPWNEAGVQGFALDKKKGVIPVATPPPAATDAVTVRTASFQLAPDGNLTGTLTVIFRKQRALQLRLSANNKDDTDRRKILEDLVKSWLPSTATIAPVGSPNWDGEAPLKARFQVTLPDFATVASGNLIFPMSALDSDDANPFTDAKRVYPIYYKYPFVTEDNTSVTLPPGFAVSGLPPSKTIPLDAAHFESSYQQQGNVIQFHREFSILDRYVAASDYQQLKNFYIQVRSADGQMVVAQPVSHKAAN